MGYLGMGDNGFECEKQCTLLGACWPSSSGVQANVIAIIGSTSGGEHITHLAGGGVGGPFGLGPWRRNVAIKAARERSGGRGNWLGNLISVRGNMRSSEPPT